MKTDSLKLYSYIAQDIERILYKWAANKYGLDAKYYVDKFAILHKDESYMSLLYGEIAVLKTQELQTRIDLLEERMNKL